MIVRPAALTVLILLFFLNTGLMALSLQDLFRGARERDRSERILSQDDLIRQAGYEKKDLKQGLSSALSTGSTGLEQKKEDGSLTNSIITTPTASMTLPYPWGTSFKLESPINITDGQNYSIGGKLGITQPLNDLTGLTRDERAKELERRLQNYQSDWEHFKVRKTLEQEVLSLLKEITGFRKSLLEKEREILVKEIAFETARRFNTLGNGTKAELSLKMELNKLRRERLQLEQNLADGQFRLAFKTGDESCTLPDLPLFTPPRLPEEELRSQAPTVIIEELKRDLQEEKLTQSRIDDPPKLSLNGGLEALGKKENGGELYMSSPKANISLKSIGKTMDVKGDLSVRDDGFTLTGALSWKQPDRRGERIDQQIHLLELEKQNLLVDKVWPEHVQKERALIRRIDDLKLRQDNVLEDIQVADQAVREQDFSWQKGYISDRERQRGLLSRQILDYEMSLLVLEALNLQREIDKYYFDAGTDSNTDHNTGEIIHED